MPDKMKMGVSACLLGREVRYDGGHKRSRYIQGILGEYMDFVPVCPEVECGMPVPRESMRLVGDPASPRLVTTRSGEDKTDQLLGWARQRVEELASEELVGFIFQKSSPSSGMERIKVHNSHGMPHKVGVGLFARAFMDRFPLIPCEDDGRLNDAGLRENFLERVFTMDRWRRTVAAEPSRGALVEFHARHKLLVMAHGQRPAKELGRLVARLGEDPIEEVLPQYLQLLMETLGQRATIKKHCNVLQHAMGYFKRVLSPDEKQELLEVIDSYRERHVPLIVPITLLNHYVRKYGEAYLAAQWYLQPHPIELKLRNHA